MTSTMDVLVLAGGGEVLRRRIDRPFSRNEFRETVTGLFHGKVKAHRTLFSAAGQGGRVVVVQAMEQGWGTVFVSVVDESIYA